MPHHLHARQSQVAPQAQLETCQSKEGAAALQSLKAVLVVQIGFMGPAIFLTRLGSVTTPMGAVACMMASQGLDSFSQSGLYSNHQVQLGTVNVTSIVIVDIVSLETEARCLG